MELAVLIPVGPRFFSLQAHDAAAAGGELVRLCGGEVEEALCQTFHSVASLRRDPRQGPALTRRGSKTSAQGWFSPPQEGGEDQGPRP